jgi:quinol monooxygenase YgiN
MYGTVARLRVKPGMEAKFVEVGRAMVAQRIPGNVATYVYQMDTNPQEFYLAVIFSNKAAYLANAESAEQNARFLELMSVLESEPEWHDGEIVSHFE